MACLVLSCSRKLNADDTCPSVVVRKIHAGGGFVRNKILGPDTQHEGRVRDRIAMPRSIEAGFVIA